MNKPIRQSSTAPMILVAAVVMLGVAALEWEHFPAGLPRELGIGALAAIALLYAFSPAQESAAWKQHGYFLAQTGLIAALLLLAPEGRSLFAFLFLITSSQAMMMLPRRLALVWLGIFALVTVVLFFYFGRFPGAWQELLPFTAGLIFVASLSYLWEQTDIARRESQRLLAELQSAHAQLQRYAARVEELTIADERNRIAREIHDTLGHTLTALDIQMELLMRLPPDQVAPRQQAIDRARQLVKQGLADARRAVQALRPVALETFPLPEALAALVEEFKRTTGIAVVWQVEGRVVPLAPRLALPLYRAAQEALTNVQRHAATTPRVTVRLGYAAKTLRLRVENAPPIAPTVVTHPAAGGYGLRGLRERAEALGGTFRAGADETGNFAVEMSLPSPRDSSIIELKTRREVLP